MNFRFFALPTAALLVLSSSIFGASLRWDQTEITLDMEPDQETIQAVFRATNEGSESIRINRVKTSCGCTGSVVDKRIVAPGESTEIIGTFSRGKRQGLNQNRLEVFVDGQREPIASLRMAVRIPTLIKATPHIVYWTPSGSRATRHVELELDERYLDTITKIDYDTANLSITEELLEPNGSKRRLSIAPLPTETPYRGTITVYATGPDGREAQSRIHAFIQL